jgi:hypothetical protein
MGNCLLDLLAVFDLDLEPIWVDNSCCFCLFCFFVSQQLELNMFFIFGLDCFKRGSAKRAWELSTGQNFIQWIAIQSCLCFWSTNFNHWLGIHWISSCPVDNLIQWITLSSILNNRAQFDKLEKELIHCLNTIAFVYMWIQLLDI